MSDLKKRLEALATRGSARGPDAVLEAAGKSVNETGAIDAEAKGQFVGGDGTEGHDFTGGDLPVIPIALAETPPRRRPRRSVFVAAGIAALLAVGTLAVTSLLGSGGADSPEGAVRELASAVNNEDLLAAADVLAPEEVRALHETLQGASEKAAELEMVDDAARPLAGVDLAVDKLEVTSEDMADGYAKVTITSGIISSSVHRAGLSKLLQEASEDGTGDVEGETADLARLDEDLPTFVMTVRHEGRWYVSPAYTALEYMRVANDLPAAEFGSGRAAKLGADSPEAAVRAAFDASAAGEWQQLLGLVPPDEIPLYDYRAAITQLATDESADDDSDDGGPPYFTVDTFDPQVDRNGDTAIVSIKASGTFGEDGTWELADHCANSSGGVWSDDDGESEHLCLANTGVIGASASVFGVNTGEGLPRVITVERNGRWYISPVGTLLDEVNTFVRNFDSRTLYTWLGLYDRIPADGSLAFGTPVTAQPKGISGAFVYTFSGQAGQEVIGDFTEPEDSSSFFSTPNTRLFGPDGEEIDDSYYLSDGESVTLPAGGEYRVVIETFGNREFTFTLWDAKDAPDDVLNPPDDYNDSGYYDEDGSYYDEDGNYCDADGVCENTQTADVCLDDPECVVGPDGSYISPSDDGVTDTTMPGSEYEPDPVVPRTIPGQAPTADSTPGI